MNRTVCLNDNWKRSEGAKLQNAFFRKFTKGELLPAQGNAPFSISRKFICPKQINDTVTVFFTGEYNSLRVFADKTELMPEKNDSGETVYNVTPCLKTGITVISAVVDSGRIDSFYFTVKRKE